jgi:hypothetical protein
LLRCGCQLPLSRYKVKLKVLFSLKTPLTTKGTITRQTVMDLASLGDAAKIDKVVKQRLTILEMEEDDNRF